MQNWFITLQNLGKSLMLPVAVLPAAALLLRLGAPDVLNIPFIMKSGNAVFENLPIIFATGIAVGFAKDSNGAAALSGLIGYLVLTAGLTVINADLNMGVLAGIVSGLTAGILYNRFHGIELPEFLGFFSGRRFIPIATAMASIVEAAIFGTVWAPIQELIQATGEWIIHAGAVGVFTYGFLNRLLIPLGLHHILNSFVYFVFGQYTNPATGVTVTGDLNRFFEGDPTAGIFMSGGFPVMMFGLPAVALAMYHTAKVENRPKVAGMLASMALTAFLTGITEPIEFSFMFLAPALYFIHAVLMGLSMVVTYEAGVLVGCSFSMGFIDYILNFGISTNPAKIIPIGLGCGVLYYIIFRWAIERYDIPTVGRLEEEKSEAEDVTTEFTAELTRALGGEDNLIEITNCLTRLRLKVKTPYEIDEAGLTKLGAKGVISKGQAVQVIFGLQAEKIANDLKLYIESKT